MNSSKKADIRHWIKLANSGALGPRPITMTGDCHGRVDASCAQDLTNQCFEFAMTIGGITLPYAMLSMIR